MFTQRPASFQGELFGTCAICGTYHLWIGVAAGRRANFELANGANNPADLVTKDLSRMEVDKHIEATNACYFEFRAEGALRVAIGEGGEGSNTPTDELTIVRPGAPTPII